MDKRAWLTILETVGLAALKATPLAPIAPAVTIAIAAAEALPGATGTEKLQHAVTLTTAAAQTAQALGVDVDPAKVAALAGFAINTAVGVTNMVHNGGLKQDPPPSPASGT